MDKPPSKPKKRTSSIKKQKSDDEMDTYISDDKQPEKPKRKSRVSPKNNIEDEHDDDLGLRTFHNLRIDSDKPKSKNSRTRKKATSGERSSGRRKEKAPDRSKSLPAGQNTESSDDVGSTSEVDVEDEGNIQPERMRSSRERRNNQKRLDSNDSFRNSGKVDTINSNDTRVSRSSHSLRRSGVRRSRSERWNKAVEIMDSDGTDDHHSINRRAQESLNRVNDGFSRSGHSRIRRHHSAGLTKMSRSMRSYSHHDIDYKRLNSIDGKRSSRRAMRHRHETDSEESFLDDNIDTATLESIDDEYEDYEEDVYRMELQTPGMIDFEEEMFDLMQRANPEVTDHLDRRVHRKREMVAFDHNMPMMTRQALLTRQASSRLRRQFLDGSNVDKKRLLLRNDSMSSSDGLAMSNHRQMRSAHKRRVPPRAKSSGLGGMGRVGYSDSFKSDSVDRRGAFRSQSIHGSHPASFNQYYQNKPNRIRSLSRRASGDLINPHSMRGSSRPNSQLAHQRAIQRTTSSTSRRRSASSDQTLSRKQDSKIYTEKNQRSSNTRVFPDEDQDTDNFDEQLEHEISKGNSSTSSFLTGKSNGSKNFDKNDMANKRNRSKLHLLLYKTKMAIDMDVLLRKVRKGDTPRLPIDSLRMPSP
ncbi:unnamed protein product [Pseudo-nitzschia multistriata]|uniref:Uncharacterized protein n=1 Tax=Pseudo-nitzschia multistriata TaxID=183589 RepID=A0A448ZGA8_9STRA|nr:unnamed protein product [Pseudo-nitzschia multistriata]